MKKLELIIRPHLLRDVKDALTSIGILGMTVSQIQGYDPCRQQILFYRGSKYTVELSTKLKVEIVTDADLLDETIQSVLAVARRDIIEDNLISISDVESALRIRTGEYNYNAI